MRPEEAEKSATFFKSETVQEPSPKLDVLPPNPSAFMVVANVAFAHIVSGCGAAGSGAGGAGGG